MNQAARPVCRAADLPAGAVRAVVVDGVPVVVVRTADDRLFALHDRCSHAQVPLSEGELVGGALECPKHGSEFDLATGCPGGPPATAPVPTYPVEVRDDHIYVTVKQGDIR